MIRSIVRLTVCVALLSLTACASGGAGGGSEGPRVVSPPPPEAAVRAEWLRGGVTASVGVAASPAITKVEIDPERDYPDVDRSDNVWTSP